MASPCPASADGSDWEWFAPDDLVVTRNTRVWVVCRRIDDRDDLAVCLVNGHPAENMVWYGDFLHASALLMIGPNVIELKIGTGDATSLKRTVFREVFGSRKSIEFDFPAYGFHEKNPEVCLDCHTMAVTEANSVKDVMRLCLQCHTELLDFRNVHGPINVGGCFSCHPSDITAAGDKSFPTNAELCFSCHSDAVKYAKSDFLHGPLNVGACTSCHNPHAGDFSFNLNYPIPDLCFFCHEPFNYADEKGSAHSPAADGECLLCHDPHGSESNFSLKKGGVLRLCNSCHSESLKKHRHPIDGKPGKALKLPGSIILNSEGNWTCTSCHNPHASVSKHLLVTEQERTCTQCHTSK
jgi:predicted CXXCH cytochrome family protein